MLNPQRISPHSIMPRYADEEGIPALTETLGEMSESIQRYLALSHSWKV